jgi:hypothetical protein
MDGKHDHQCNCVACLIHLEKELQVHLDEWMPNQKDVQQMLQGHLNEWLPNQQAHQLQCTSALTEGVMTGIRHKDSGLGPTWSRTEPGVG